MGITGMFRGNLANNLRQMKQFYEWFRNTDVTLKELKKYDAAADSLRELAKISDIRSLKPVAGWKRKLQLDSVKVAAEAQKILDKENITAFLFGGNLLGYVRHGGFVPWDDDFDFAILRQDYNRLLKHFEDNESLLIMRGDTYEDDIRVIDRFCESHPGQPVLVKFYDIAQFSIATNHVKRITVDFFPFDFIKDGTGFDEYKRYICGFRDRLKTVPRSEKERFIADNEKKNLYASDTPTSLICSGLDYIPFGWLYERAHRFILSSYLFPGERGDFEGENFIIPADPKAFLDIIYSAYDSYPSFYADGGAKAHESLNAEWFVKHGTKAELIVHSEEEIKAYIPLYDNLRDNNVFAEFINCIEKDKWGQILDKYEVRYSFRRNYNSKWAITAGDIKELEKYKNNKLLFTGDTEAALRRMTNSDQIDKRL